MIYHSDQALHRLMTTSISKLPTHQPSSFQASMTMFPPPMPTNDVWLLCNIDHHSLHHYLMTPHQPSCNRQHNDDGHAVWLHHDHHHCSANVDYHYDHCETSHTMMMATPSAASGDRSLPLPLCTAMPMLMATTTLAWQLLWQGLTYLLWRCSDR